VYSDHVVGCR